MPLSVGLQMAVAHAPDMGKLQQAQTRKLGEYTKIGINSGFGINLVHTWTPKMCKIMAQNYQNSQKMPLFYILMGSRLYYIPYARDSIPHTICSIPYTIDHMVIYIYAYIYIYIYGHPPLRDAHSLKTL